MSHDYDDDLVKTLFGSAGAMAFSDPDLNDVEAALRAVHATIRSYCPEALHGLLAALEDDHVKAKRTCERVAGLLEDNDRHSRAAPPRLRKIEGGKT